MKRNDVLGTNSQTIGVVLELGDPLGFATYRERDVIARRVQQMGGKIVSVIDTSVKLVLSRDIESLDEFLSSTVLHGALQNSIPVVRCNEFLQHAEALPGLASSGIVRALDHVKQFLVRMPSQCAAEVEATRFTSLQKVAQRVFVEKYDESHAIQLAEKNLPQPLGWPSWTVEQLKGYYVVRECMTREGMKVELHCTPLPMILEGVSSNHNQGGTAPDTKIAPGAPMVLPFRVFVAREDYGAVGVGDATFYADAEEAEKCFRLQTLRYGSLDSTLAPNRAFGSLHSCAHLDPWSSVAARMLPPSLHELVGHLFRESWLQLIKHSTLKLDPSSSASPLGSTTLLDVVKAEGLLIRLGELLALDMFPDSRTGDFDDTMHKKTIQQLSSAFFKLIPSATDTPINTLDTLDAASDVVRCVRVMLSSGESCFGNVYNASPGAQLAALNVSLREVDRSSPCFARLMQAIAESEVQSSRAKVVSRIFEVRREDEVRLYEKRCKSLFAKNTQLLFHGTRAGNVVPILGQGLQLPVCQRLRRDHGMLGRAIYFGSSIDTALKYSSVGIDNPRQRYVFLSEVGVGRAFETRRHVLGATSPPEGYDSVHAVPTPDGDFEDHEFAIYDAGQVRLSYLVEFTEDCHGLPLQANTPSLPPQSVWSAPSTSALPSNDTDAVVLPNGKVKIPDVGLQSSSGQAVPLRNTRIRAQVIDLIGQVDVLQEYYNDSTSPLETKYVFPLQSGCAVCGFEAYINEKKIVGRVKEKEEARREYKAAVERGDGAYLMDESEETPDVFTVSVGNLPPQTNVVIRITYVLELRVHPDLKAVEFIVPSAIMPTTAKVEALTQVTQAKTRTAWADAVASGGSVGIEVSLDMPFDIQRIECSHAAMLRKKRSACRAVLSGENINLGSEDFVLYCSIASIATPRIWIETHPQDQTRAAMITFFPEVTPDVSTISTEDRTKSREVLLVLDCSASMGEGGAIEAARQAAVMFLRAMPRHWRFNVTLCGSVAISLFATSRSASLPHVEEAVRYVGKSCGPWLGGSCLESYLTSLGAFYASASRSLDVVFVTDGLLPDGDRRLCCTLERQSALRVFSFVVGKTSNPTLMRSLCTAGRGQTEVLSDSSKSKWSTSVQAQIRRLSHVAFSSIQVDWCTEDSRRLRNAINSTVTQSPRHVATLFNTESLVVYGIVKHNAMQCEVIATQSGPGMQVDAYGLWPEHRFLVTANSTCFCTGMIVHRLCAKSRIREFTDGLLCRNDSSEGEAKKEATKKMIIDLGCTYGLVTPFTSMIAVEERTEEERQGKRRLDAKPTPSIDSVGPSVDVLPEQSFEDVLVSDDEGVVPVFDVVSKAQRKALKEEARRRAARRLRRLQEDWLAVVAPESIVRKDGQPKRPAAGRGPESATCDSDSDEALLLGMGEAAASTQLYHYESPSVHSSPRESEAESTNESYDEARAKEERGVISPMSRKASKRRAVAYRGYKRSLGSSDASSSSASARCAPERNEVEEADDDDAGACYFDKEFVADMPCPAAPEAVCDEDAFAGFTFSAIAEEEAGEPPSRSMSNKAMKRDEEPERMLQELRKQRVGVEKELVTLKGKQKKSVEEFEESENALYAAGVEFNHPVDENNEVVLARRSKIVEYRAHLSKQEEVKIAVEREAIKRGRLLRSDEPTPRSVPSPPPPPPPPAGAGFGMFGSPPPQMAFSTSALGGMRGGVGGRGGRGGPPVAMALAQPMIQPRFDMPCPPPAFAFAAAAPCFGAPGAVAAAAAPRGPPPPAAPSPLMQQPRTFACFAAPSSATATSTSFNMPMMPARLPMPPPPPSASSIPTPPKPAAAICTRFTDVRSDESSYVGEARRRSQPPQQQTQASAPMPEAKPMSSRERHSSSLSAPSEAPAPSCQGGGRASRPMALEKKKKSALPEEERRIGAATKGDTCKEGPPSRGTRTSSKEQLESVQRSVECTRRVMAENIATVLDRGEALDDLVAKCNMLSEAVAQSMSLSAACDDAKAMEELEDLMEGVTDSSEPASLLLSGLPTHFSESSLSIKCKRVYVSRCPSTGGCLGEARVVLDIEALGEEGAAACLAHLLMICEHHDWKCRLSDSTEDSIVDEVVNMTQSIMQRRVSDIRRKSTALLSALPKGGSKSFLIDAMLSTTKQLDEILGLDAGALWQLYHVMCRMQQPPIQWEGNQRAFGSFLGFIDRLVSQRPSEEGQIVTSDAETYVAMMITSYSSRYYPPWRCFTLTDCPAEVRPTQQPFPLVAVDVPDARNYYDEE